MAQEGSKALQKFIRPTDAHSSWAQQTRSVKDNDEFGGPRPGQASLIDTVRFPEYKCSLLFSQPAGVLKDKFSFKFPERLITVVAVYLKMIVIEGSTELLVGNDLVAINVGGSLQDENRHSVLLGDSLGYNVPNILEKKHIVPLRKHPWAGGPALENGIFEPKQLYTLQVYQRPKNFVDNISIEITGLDGSPITAQRCLVDLLFQLQKW